MKAEAISIEREPVSEAPDCKALFTGFMQLGLMGFGGVLPLAHRIIVEDKKWIDEGKFTDLLGVCNLSKESQQHSYRTFFTFTQSEPSIRKCVYY